MFNNTRPFFASFLLFSVLLLFQIHPLSAQLTYHHGIGAGIQTGIFNIEYKSSTRNYGGTSVQQVPGVFYKSSLLFGDSGPVVGVSAYPFLGFSGGLNSRTGGSGAAVFEIPVNAELYLGDPYENCFFIGAGYSAAFFGASEGDSGPIMGPQVAIGGQGDIFDNLLGARIAAGLGTNDTEFSDPSTEVITDKKYLISLEVFWIFE